MYAYLTVPSLKFKAMKDGIPNKPVFSPGDPRRRKRSYILIGILIFLQLGMIWPVYSFFASPTPLILGFPLSIVWVTADLILCALSVLIYYLNDDEEEEAWKAG